MKKNIIKKILASGVAVCLGAGLIAGAIGCSPKNDGFIEENFISADGTQSGYPDQNGKFSPAYGTKKETLEKNAELNKEIAGEGFVLLKNADNTLPLKGNNLKVSLFGHDSVYVRTSGGGSGTGKTDIYCIPFTNIKDGLEADGFKVNPALYSVFEANPGGEINASAIGASVKNTYAEYKDAAILVFGRSGSEGSDLPRRNVWGHSNASDHYLQLDDNEISLVRHAKENFNKVIVLLNTANVMEISCLNEKKTANNLGVDAVVQIGHLGNDGAASVGKILNGTINPSGHTVDTWATDFKKMPSWTNFGDNSQVGGETQMYLYNGEKAPKWFSVEYREDIYVGYRYYETKCAEMNKKTAGSGDEWYNENVLYPFGYGLSYTTFDWELSEDIQTKATIAAANQTVTTKVKVTNTGSVAGKDVVQIYAEQPYYAGGIEKSAAVLAGFAKTKLLNPGESEVVTVQFVAQDIASFDWDDANNNGFIGYELEAGDYIISARKNVHEKAFEIVRSVAENITCPTDYTTGKKINAVFSQTDGKWADYISVKDSLLENLMTRNSDMLQPATTTKDERTLTRAEASAIESRRDDFIAEDDEDDAWWISEVPSSWTQGAGVSERVDGKTQIQLADMAGIPFTAPTVDKNGKVTVADDENSQKWEEFLNQFTWEELQSLAVNGNYGRPENSVAGLLKQTDWDGPVQVGGLNGDPERIGTYWVSPYIMGSTWNTEIMTRLGKAVGDECLHLNVGGWYAPGMNIHRSPFGGRNFDYYSEDGLLSGKIAAAVCRGSAQKGVIAYVKHAVLNDQETNRDSDRGLFTWASEQAIREIYLKPFELAVKEGHTLGTMNCANRIGSWVGYSQGALQTGIFRGEWDFKGITLTDAGGGGWDFARINSLWRNGTSLPLGFGDPEPTEFRDNMVYGKSSGSSSFDLASPTQWYWCRLSVAYNMYAAANSLAIRNGIMDGGKIRIDMKTNTVYNESPFTLEVFGSDSVSEVKISYGALPKGLTLSADGIISGTPASAGTWGCIVTCRVDGWLDATVKIRIVVSE